MQRLPSVWSLNSLSPSFNINCATPSGLVLSTVTPQTLLTDDTNAYVTAQSSTTSGAAVAGIEPGTPCATSAAVAIPGTLPAQSFTSNDPGHGRFYVVSGFAGQGIDTLTVHNNLNTNSSSTPTLTQQARVALPAVGAFIIPAANNANGDLLVLINQDNLTSANLSSPLLDTTPITIIDVGQLRRTFSAVVASGKTVTLPFVTQIHSTTPYFGMLGAAYNPVFHLIYALAASGSSAATSTGVTQSIIRYDPTNPSSPAETVVADESIVSYNVGTILNLRSTQLRVSWISSLPVHRLCITAASREKQHCVCSYGNTFPR